MYFNTFLSSIPYPWADNNLVLKSLMQALDGRCINQSVITPKVVSKGCFKMCLFRGSGNNSYKTYFFENIG